jgi:DNA-binding NarL/FixJ family response regulator
MKLSVVVVDDHRIVRDGVRLLLEAHPEEFILVDEAGDGREALEAVRRLRPDVVMMDVTMPSLNGVDATHEVLSVSPNTRVIALSGTADEQRVAAMFKAGARAYVVKEAGFDELLLALRTVSAGQVFLSGSIATPMLLHGLRPREGAEPGLTHRQREVLQLLAEGLTSKEIGNQLGIGVKTVETHRKQIMDALNIRTIAGLTKYALRAGLTTASEVSPSLNASRPRS